ncbi:non-structural maintenance of chromosomes element 1, partial [Tremellales sp. Uapishka_1]
MALLTDLHRLYIQNLFSRRSMPEEVGYELYKRAVGAVQTADETFRPDHNVSKVGYSDFLEELRNPLSELGMGIKTGMDESERGRLWLVLVNINPASPADLATDYSPLEISYFREMITAIITSHPENSIGSNAAIRVARTLETPLATSMAESLLETFVARGYFLKSKRGRYSLAPRAMFELEIYLKEEFPDYVQLCKRCHKQVQAGVICTKPDCEAHYHSYCYATLQRAPQPTCLGCKSRFDQYDPSPLGEKAVSRSRDDWGGDARARRRRGWPSRNGEEEDEITDEEDESQEQAGNNTQVVGAGPSGWRASTGRTNGNASTQLESEEEEDEPSQRPKRRRKQ